MLTSGTCRDIEIFIERIGIIVINNGNQVNYDIKQICISSAPSGSWKTTNLMGLLSASDVQFTKALHLEKLPI